MKRESAGPILSTVFVDYDNIYLSLKRKSEEAAKRFAKDSGIWLQSILSGELITPTSSFTVTAERRIVMNRCYGNPVPRRNAHDNSTDMNSFPFVRHHFLRAGFEVIDCPPLTQQLKNSADIRIVMDIRDILNHDTYFDEFIIMSGDADFTPLLHRLRAHARRTVVFANDHTAQPYTALTDGEIRESNLINALLSGRAVAGDSIPRELAAPTAQPMIDVEAARKQIVAEVVGFVRSAPQAVPLETLADRAVRIVGRDKTIGSNWGGFGSFRDLLLADLPDDIHLSDTPPYTVFDATRHISAAGLIAPQLAPPQMTETRRRDTMTTELPAAPAPQTALPGRAYQQMQPQRAAFDTRAPAAPAQQPVARQPEQPIYGQPDAPMARQQPPQQAMPSPTAYQPDPRRDMISRQSAPAMGQPQMGHSMPATATAPPQGHAPQPPVPQRNAEQATQIQQSIARIHEACQAPALAPAEYRVLFDVMAQEISANGLQGSQTLVNITQRTREFGLDLKRDDLRFILEVVSESDPWFEQGASAGLFASRFRNFVVARCRSQGLSLSADELDLIEAWFSAPQPQQARAPGYGRGGSNLPAQPAPNQQPGDRWSGVDDGRQSMAEQRGHGDNYAGGEREDEFPRIVRSRLRG